jgi:GAF domain-containing protein
MKPKTVLQWHAIAFLQWWRWKSRREGGRPAISQEMRPLIRRLSRENVLWSAETIHGPAILGHENVETLLCLGARIPPTQHRLVAQGIRAYTSVPMKVRGKLIGNGVFTRRAPVEFDQDQISLLSDVSRALSVAVTNALANEEIRALRDQLESENVELRAQLGQAPWFEEIVGHDGSAHRRDRDRKGTHRARHPSEIATFEGTACHRALCGNSRHVVGF